MRLLEAPAARTPGAVIARMAGSSTARDATWTPINFYRVWSITAAFATVMVAAVTTARFEYAIRFLDPGIDYETLIGATRNFVSGGGFYPAEELAGPWVYHEIDSPFGPAILYPPDALLLFLPFLVLPKILWWAIPISIVAWAVWRLRPHPAAILVMVLLLGVPYSRESIFWGNPVMWMVAATAAGLVVGWPGVFVLLKPTLAPFALAGFPRRSWLIALLALAAINVPLLPMWADWVTVIRNSQLGPGFSWHQYPLMAVPVVAWLGSRHGPLAGRLSPGSVTD
jgi:hypothetical protein